MKFYVAILLMVVSLTWAAQVHDNGQPGCKTAEEIKVQNYRNTWDPTRYWTCNIAGQPGVETKCPGGTAWLDSQKRCIEWENWVWEEPVPPPSKP